MDEYVGGYSMFYVTSENLLTASRPPHRL